MRFRNFSSKTEIFQFDYHRDIDEYVNDEDNDGGDDDQGLRKVLENEL